MVFDLLWQVEMEGGSLSITCFRSIHRELAMRSDVWADLWQLIYHTHVSTRCAVNLRFDDVTSDYINFRRRGRFHQQSVALNGYLNDMILRRRMTYPDDIFVFQSHSNRVKNTVQPVTVIAFNHVLGLVSQSMYGIKISSSSARKVYRTEYE